MHCWFLYSNIYHQINRTYWLSQGIPPRGENPNPLREKIAKVNASVCQQLDDVPNCTFLNVDPALFIGADGKISPNDMYDYLHFTSKGYQKLCEPLLELVQDLLQEFVKVENTSQDSDSLAGDLATKDPWTVLLIYNAYHAFFKACKCQYVNFVYVSATVHVLLCTWNDFAHNLVDRGNWFFYLTVY